MTARPGIATPVQRWSSNAGWRFDITSNGTVTWYTGVSTIHSSSAGAVPLNTWTHIAASGDGTQTRLFVNGTLVSGPINNTWPDPSATLQIGALNSGSDVYPFFGFISNVRVIKGTQLYTSNFTPPTSPLSAVSGTSVLLNFNNAAIDDTRRKNNLETWNAQVSTTQSKFGGASMYFDGAGGCLVGAPSPNFYFGTGDMTIEAWIWWDGTYSSGARIIYANAVDQFGIFNASGLYWGGISNNVTANFPPINQWAHVAGSRQGNTIRLFINGIQTASGTISSTSTLGTTTGVPFIGRRGEGFYPWLGYIDDLRITKGAALYTSNFTPPASAHTITNGGTYPITSENALTLGGTSAANLKYNVPNVSTANDFNSSTHGNVACNWLNWPDAAAYADWSGMRPMSELEFEKASRGTSSPAVGEPASGSTCAGDPNLTAATGISNSGAANETASNTSASAVYNNQASVQGPLRSGALATSSSTRTTAGAGFYGIMDLSGNATEQVVSIGNSTGRSFTGSHGNGALNANGNADISTWPGYVTNANTGATGSGKRGGSWEDIADRLLISDRFQANSTVTTRDRKTGFRAARSLPSTAAQ